MSTTRRFMMALCVFVTPLVLLVALLIGVREAPSDASSHREAPLVSKDPFADNTDTYAWIPQGITDRIVLAASWIPFEGPEGGPNYWEWDNNVQYRIYVDNNGDAEPDLSYILTSTTTVENPETFLYNTNAINSLDDPDWNLKQRITVIEDMGGITMTTLVDNELTTPSNLGPKSIPDHGSLEEEGIYTAMVPEGEIKIFAGQTDDPFWVDLQVFDLLTLRGQASPIGYADGPNNPVDSVAGFNVHSLIIELPIARVTQGDEPVIGVWATAMREKTQVSRLGMPLVNEAVLPLALKDAFNSIPPSADALLYTGGFGTDAALLTQRSVEDPELGRLLCALYGVPLPADADDNCSTDVDSDPMTIRTGRGDIFDIFLTGMVLTNPYTITTAGGPVMLPADFNVNQPEGVVPAEMIRINTAISGELCHPTPQRLGVLAGDACGFPNGRRPMDDVVEIELLAVAGAAYQVLDNRDNAFSFNPALINVLDDGLNSNDVPFRDEFPYFAAAQSGRDHVHTNECQIAYLPPALCGVTGLSFGNLQLSANSAPWLQLIAALASISLVGGVMRLRKQS